MRVCDDISFFIDKKTAPLTDHIPLLIVGHNDDDGGFHSFYQSGQVFLTHGRRNDENKKEECTDKTAGL